jgi:hypothetical protein
MRIPLRALLIAVIGVGVIDYFSHLLFSNPMETTSYFLAKMTLYFVFSLIVLYYFKFQGHEFWKVTLAGVIVALMWGTYYNILPVIFDFYPFGIPLRDLSFWGMGLLGTGLAFGIVHTLAFVGGYYATKKIR